MEKIDQFKNLLVMAAADGSLTDREIAFLSDRSQSWGSRITSSPTRFNMQSDRRPLFRSPIHTRNGSPCSKTCFA